MVVFYGLEFLEGKVVGGGGYDGGLDGCGLLLCFLWRFLRRGLWRCGCGALAGYGGDAPKAYVVVEASVIFGFAE